MQLHIRGNNSHVLNVEHDETVAEIKVNFVDPLNETIFIFWGYVYIQCAVAIEWVNHIIKKWKKKLIEY